MARSWNNRKVRPTVLGTQIATGGNATIATNRVNRFGGLCKNCSVWVAPEEGVLLRVDGSYKVQHKAGGCGAAKQRSLALLPPIHAIEESLDLSALDETSADVPAGLHVVNAPDPWEDNEDEVERLAELYEEQREAEIAAEYERHAVEQAIYAAQARRLENLKRIAEIDAAFGLRDGMTDLDA